MQTQNPKTSSFSVERCLMSLKKLTIMGSSSVANSSSSSSSSSSPSSPLGDYIGIESCLDLKGNDDISEDDGSQSLSRERRRNERDLRWGKSAAKKEFPPPIPLLARTENLTSHMPWVLKRYYTNDGRLILKEERVKHHEYFLAQRCNGRLTLQLIPLDDEVNNYPPCFVQEEEDEEEEAIDVSSDEEDIQKEGEEEIAEVNHENEEVKEESENDNYVVNYQDQRSNNSNGGLGGNLSPPFKCLNYNTMIQASTCIFQMPVPALRPVHT